MKTVKFIFPHQLFQDNPLFDHDGDCYLIEEYLFFKQYPFHQQKIAFHRASMKYYEAYLTQEQRQQVHYIDAHDARSDVRQLIASLSQEKIQAIEMLDPVDDWLKRRVQEACGKAQIQLHILDSPLFLNTEKELEAFFHKGKKKFFQTDFYKQERIKRTILISDTGTPTGGQWTYDVENRKKYPKGKQIVGVEFPAPNSWTEEAFTYTKQHFSHHLGELNPHHFYPIGFQASQQWLDDFLTTRFDEFGDYEDAIVQKEIVLHHSLLTPMLNVGMLTPQLIIKRTLQYAHTHQVPINSLEGFIRQIIGWREFIRGVYISKGREERTRNFWGFNRKIPKSFYNGTTGILPIDLTIQKVLKTGYCHHIERLMVLGNFMLLCEFDPDEVYQWFMELFIDAYDWVMVPNVYGMSQFADGGIMSTKPYISGSNYLMKMSDYPKGNWQTIWDALFWRFMDVNRSFFLKNPRLGMLVKSYDKWPETKKQNIQQIAQNYLHQL